jgi:hypothetical protein
MTRSLLSFFTGQLELSFEFNPLGPLVGGMLCVAWLLSFRQLLFAICYKQLRKLAPIALVSILVWGAFRNLAGW